MSLSQFRTFCYGVAVELTWWATRPLVRLLDRGRR